MDLVDFICEKLNRKGADVYLDVHDFLAEFSLEELFLLSAKHGFELHSRSGRWIMPLFSKPEVA